MKTANDQDLYQAALECTSHKLSVIVVDAEKKPLRNWKTYQEKIATPFDLNAQCEDSRAHGIALIGGKISDQLYQLDFEGKDHKGDPMENVYHHWAELAQIALDHVEQLHLFERLYVTSSRNGGMHVRWRVDTSHTLSNKKLAAEWAIDKETGEVLTDERGKPKTDLLIECRGEGGYCLCPPSPGYEVIQGSITEIPTIDVPTHNLLVGAAKSLHKAVDDIKRESVQGNRPGDDFNQRGNHHELLTAAGWKLDHETAGIEYWLRPEKNKGWSATWNFIAERFYCFSTNAEPFESERLYDKFGIYTVLQHDGDFAAAAKQLAREGYGEKEAPQSSTHSPTHSPASDWIPYSDTYTADRIVELHGDDIRWCDVWQKWLTWTGARWEVDTALIVHRKAEATIRGMIPEAAAMKTDEAQLFLKYIKSALGQNKVEAAVRATRRKVTIEPHELDCDPWLLNCRNGTVNLSTGELFAHKRNDFITKLCPVDFVPDAISTLWNRFTETVIPDENIRSFVQRCAGYSATGLANEEVLFFPYGPTATGKSTLLSAIEYVLGDYAATADFETLLADAKTSGRPKTELARLVGKRLVISTEVKQGARLAQGMLKWITGQDKVVARFLYGDEFEFLPSFCLWLAANHRPKANDDDDAIWRRILQIPFDTQIEKSRRDTGLKEKLRADTHTEAILAWIVQGTLAWKESGLAVPAVVEQTTEEYRREMNPLHDFILEMCILGPNEYETSQNLWDAYEQWAEDNGIKFKMSRIQFGKRLEAVGCDSARMTLDGMTTRCWIGIRLATEDDLPEPDSESEKLHNNASNASNASNDKEESSHSPSSTDGRIGRIGRKGQQIGPVKKNLGKLQNHASNASNASKTDDDEARTRIIRQIDTLCWKMDIPKRQTDFKTTEELSEMLAGLEELKKRIEEENETQ